MVLDFKERRNNTSCVREGPHGVIKKSICRWDWLRENLVEIYAFKRKACKGVFTAEAAPIDRVEYPDFQT